MLSPGAILRRLLRRLLSQLPRRLRVWIPLRRKETIGVQNGPGKLLRKGFVQLGLLLDPRRLPMEFLGMFRRGAFPLLLEGCPFKNSFGSEP